ERGNPHPDPPPPAGEGARDSRGDPNARRSKRSDDLATTTPSPASGGGWGWGLAVRARLAEAGSGVSGVAEIGFAVRDGATRLTHLYQHDPMRVLFPQPEAG